MVLAIPSEKPNRHWNKDRSTEPIQRILQNEKHTWEMSCFKKIILPISS